MCIKLKITPGEDGFLHMTSMSIAKPAGTGPSRIRTRTTAMQQALGHTVCEPLSQVVSYLSQEYC